MRNMKPLFAMLVLLLPVQAAASDDAKQTVRHESATAAATDVVFEGSASYEAQGGQVTIEVDQVTNRSSSTTSGTLTMKLWATSTSNPVGSGYELASVQLGELSPNQYYYDIVQTTSFTAPPAGTYYIHLILVEYPNLSTIIDHITFGQQTFGGTGGGGGGGGDGGTGGGGGDGGTGGGGGGGSLKIVGKATPAYTSDGYIAEIHFPGEQRSVGTVSIINERSTGTGALKIRMVASQTRYTGGTLTGYRMADYDLPQALSAGAHYADFVAYVSPLSSHPDYGQYYTYVLLMERDSSGEYKIADYREWDGLVTIGCGTTSACLGGSGGDDSSGGDSGGGVIHPLLLLLLPGVGVFAAINRRQRRRR